MIISQPQFENLPFQSATPYNQYNQNMYESQTSLVTRRNNFAKKIFKPIRRLSFLPKEASGLKKILTIIFSVLLFLIVVIVVLALIPLYKDLLTKSRRFAVHFEDAFKQNDSQFFKLVSTAPENRNEIENEELSNILKDIKTQLNNKTLLKISPNLVQVSDLKAKPVENNTVSISFTVVTNPITNAENNELKQKISNVSNDPDFYKDIIIKTHVTTAALIQNEATLSQEPLLINSVLPDEPPDFVLSSKEKFPKPNVESDVTLHSKNDFQVPNVEPTEVTILIGPVNQENNMPVVQHIPVLINEANEFPPVKVPFEAPMIERPFLEGKPILNRHKPNIEIKLPKQEENPMKIESIPIIQEGKPIKNMNKPFIKPNKPIIETSKPLIIPNNKPVKELKKPPMIENKPVIKVEKPGIQQNKPIRKDNKQDMVGVGSKHPNLKPKPNKSIPNKPKPNKPIPNKPKPNKPIPNKPTPNKPVPNQPKPSNNDDFLVITLEKVKPSDEDKVVQISTPKNFVTVEHKNQIFPPEDYKPIRKPAYRPRPQNKNSFNNKYNNNGYQNNYGPYRNDGYNKYNSGGYNNAGGYPPSSNYGNINYNGPNQYNDGYSNYNNKYPEQGNKNAQMGYGYGQGNKNIYRTVYDGGLNMGYKKVDNEQLKKQMDKKFDFKKARNNNARNYMKIFNYNRS